MHSTNFAARGASRRLRRLLGAGAVAALALTACGGDDDDTVSTDAPTPQEPAPADSTAGTDAAPDGTDASATTTGADEGQSGATTPADTPTTDAGTPQGDAVDGGSLTMLHPFPFAGFDPATGTTATNFMVHAFSVYDALAIVNTSDGTTALRLLESAESDDGLTWTLGVRPDVVFSDGTPFDAEAIKFNWDRLADPATGAVQAGIAQSIAGITVLDELTLEVVLAEPNGQFPYTIASSALAWIGSPTALEADPEGFAANPVGAGAFTVADWTPNSEVRLQRNPDYFGSVHLDELVIREISDEAQRLSTLQAGDGDLTLTVNGLTARSAIDAGYGDVSTSPNGGYALFFNVTAEPFDDVRARRAVALAMNGEQLSDTVYGGFREPVTNIFHETSAFYDASLDLPAPDDAAAQALIDELADEQGGPLELTLSYVGAFTAEAEWFQTKLAGFDNVEVTLDPVDSADFQQRYTSGDVQFGIHSFPVADPDQLSNPLMTGGPTNFSHYSNPAVDALFEAGRGAMEVEERRATYAELQQIVIDEVPILPFLRQQAWWVFDTGVVGGLAPDILHGASGVPMLNELWVTR